MRQSLEDAEVVEDDGNALASVMPYIKIDRVMNIMNFSIFNIRVGFTYCTKIIIAAMVERRKFRLRFPIPDSKEA